MPEAFDFGEKECKENHSHSTLSSDVWFDTRAFIEAKNSALKDRLKHTGNHVVTGKEHVPLELTGMTDDNGGEPGDIRVDEKKEGESAENYTFMPHPQTVHKGQSLHDFAEGAIKLAKHSFAKPSEQETETEMQRIRKANHLTDGDVDSAGKFTRDIKLRIPYPEDPKLKAGPQKSEKPITAVDAKSDKPVERKSEEPAEQYRFMPHPQTVHKGQSLHDFAEGAIKLAKHSFAKPPEEEVNKEMERIRKANHLTDDDVDSAGKFTRDIKLQIPYPEDPKPKEKPAAKVPGSPPTGVVNPFGSE